MPTTDLARNASRTKDYCARDIYQGTTRGRSADIFSLGAVFLEMCLAKSGPQDLLEPSKVLETDQNRSYSKNIHNVYDLVKRKLYFTLTATNAHLMTYCSNGAAELSICRLAASFQKQRAIINCKVGTASMVKGLLLGDTDPNTMGALHFAAEDGSLEVVKDLLLAGAAFDSWNATGQTAFHVAAHNGIEDAVGLLLKTGASMNARDGNEQTVFQGAAAHGHVSVVRGL